MKRDAESNRTKIGAIMEKVSIIAVSCIGILIFSVLTCYSAFYTQYYILSEEENILCKKDNWAGNIVCMLICTAMFYVLWKYVLERIHNEKWKMRIFLAIVLIYIGGVCVLRIFITRSVPNADPAMVYWAARYFSIGTYDFMGPEGYLNLYPQQYGLIALYEMLFRIFRQNSYKLIQCMNACCIVAAVFAGYHITNSWFENKRINFYYLLLVSGCLPLFMYTTFVYGDIPAITLALFMVWMFTLYCKKRHRLYLLSGVVFGVSAVLLKKNMLVVFIAVTIIMAIYACKEKCYAGFLLCLVMFIAAGAADFGIKQIYEKRSGYEVGEGIPTILWIAMGMQESKCGSGFYNAYNERTYIEAGYDGERASLMAYESINERLAAFAAKPGQAVNFYARKFLSQWNVPSYQCFLESLTFEKEPSGFLKSLYFGRLYEKVLTIMDRYQFIIYAGCLLFAVCKRKKEYPVYVYILWTSIIGGVLFSLIWEAAGRYILPYFVFMIPYAAAGIYFLQEKILGMAEKWKGRIEEKKQKAEKEV